VGRHPHAVVRVRRVRRSVELSTPTRAQRTVNDLARVIDSGSAGDLDRVIRALKAATGDVLVVATVPTVAPYADIREYALKLFENHGRGVGDKGKDNGS